MKKSLLLLGILLVAATVLSSSTTTFANSVPLGNATNNSVLATINTLAPVADSYADQSNPTTNYGSSTQIRVDGSPLVYAYLRFNVSGLSGAVTLATLRVYTNSSSSAGYSVYGVADNTWSESTLNYNNKPAMGAAVKSSGAFGSAAWTSVDVTSLVAGNGTFSFALTGNNSTAISLASRESSNLPQLVVTTSGTASPTPTSSSTMTATAIPPTKTPTATSVPPTKTPTATRVPPTATATSRPPIITPTPVPGGDPIIFFNGDLVSSSSLARAQSVVALIKNLMAQHAGTPMLVASTGDNEQESTPTLSAYQKYFGTTYATFVTQGIFRQVRGNHDVQDAGHGAAYAQYFGNPPLNYSYDLGSWHLVGIDELNGTVNQTALTFLKADLAAHAGSKCQIVYWHVPTYSSGSAHGDSTGLKSLNQAEYDAGVDIQINGHDHDYQRFYPLDPNGKRNDAKGITTFIDGIGGEDGRSGSKTSVAQAASALYLDTFPGGNGDHAIGVIMFTLHTSSANYALYDANNGAVLDQGTVNCH